MPWLLPPPSPWEKPPSTIDQAAGWTPEPGWTFEEERKYPALSAVAVPTALYYAVYLVEAEV